MVEVDLKARAIASETRVGQNAAWWAEAIDGAIWSYAPSDGLRRFDLTTQETEVFSGATVGHTEECCIAVDNAIWLVSHDGPVWRFDLDTHEVTNKLNLDVVDDAVGSGLNSGIAAAGAIWIPNHGDSAIYRIDLGLREVSDVIRVGAEPTQPVFAEGALWVSNSAEGTVSRIDVETRRVTHTIEVGRRPKAPLDP